MSRAKQRTATHKERKTNLKIKNKNKQGLTWLERKRIENLKKGVILLDMDIGSEANGMEYKLG